MFKKKCLKCGAKNDNARTICIECGATFQLEETDRATEDFRDKTAVELYIHLLTLGIQTQMLDGHPL